MAASDTARLIASLELKDRLSPGIKSANKSLGSLETRAYKVGRNIGTGIANAGKIAAVGVAALASQVALGLDSLIKLEQAEAQTAAVLKSTGQAAGQNGADITRLAEKYEALNATIGDEFIRAGENMLLTFTNIKGKAFEPTLAAVLDLNTAMGKGPEGLTKTAILVGKALNDPTKGLTALTRVGVAFSKDQVKRIKALQKEGKLYEAQKIILGELNKEFGGSFLAQGDTTAGKVAKFTDSIEDLQRSLAEALLPAIGNVADELSTFLQGADVKKGVADLGRDIGKLFSKENIGKGIELVKGAFRFAKEAAPVVAQAAQIMGSAVKTAVNLFKSLPPEIQALAVGGLAVNKLTGGLVTNLAGGLISAVLKQLVSGVVNVNGGVVNVTGPQTGLPGGGGGGATPAAKGLGAVGGLVGLIGAVVAVEEAVKAINTVGAVNTDLGDKGLNAAEIAAIKYYQSSIAEQQYAAKRLGYVPTKADFEAGMAKLASHQDSSTAAVEQMRARLGTTIVAAHKDSATKQSNAIEKVRAGIQIAHHDSVNKQNAAIERLRAGIGSSLSNHGNRLVAAAARTSAAATAAGRIAKSGGDAAARAIDRKDLSVDVRTNVNVSTSVSIRDLGKTIVRSSRYGRTVEIL